MDPLSRRAFLSSLAAALAVGSSRTAVVAADSPSTPLRTSAPPYVHHDAGGLLSFGRRHDDFREEPQWTWKQHVAHEYMRDHEAEKLNAATLEYAKDQFSNETGAYLDDLDEEAFTRWLEEPHPDDGNPDGEAWAWWVNNESSTAQAAQIIDMLGLVSSEDREGYGYEDGVSVESFPWREASVDEQGVQRLKDAIVARGLEIELVEVR